MIWFGGHPGLSEWGGGVWAAASPPPSFQKRTNHLPWPPATKTLRGHNKWIPRGSRHRRAAPAVSESPQPSTSTGGQRTQRLMCRCYTGQQTLDCGCICTSELLWLDISVSWSQSEQRAELTTGPYFPLPFSIYSSSTHTGVLCNVPPLSDMGWSWTLSHSQRPPNIRWAIVCTTAARCFMGRFQRHKQHHLCRHTHNSAVQGRGWQLFVTD